MSFQRKLIVVALASAMPWVSAQAQSTADLKKEIELLKAQLQMLQQKIEAVSAKSDTTALQQQVSRIELKQDQAQDDSEKSGLKGLNFKGTIAATYITDDRSNIHTFRATDGNDGTAFNGGTGMLELTKQAEGGEGINWTLRVTPGAGTNNINEASISAPIGDVANGNRVIGGLIPDWTGYEGLFANQNPLVTHNAIFDFLSATSYEGVGMSHQLYSGGGQTVALKWMVGNIDSVIDTDSSTGQNVANAAGDLNRSVGAAYRLDWTLSEYAFLGFAGHFGNGNRAWQIYEVDGGYTRGDWSFNGMYTYGLMKNAAALADANNGGQLEASWWGLSGLAAYKVTPRLQLIARADYIGNESNGGGTYGGGNTFNGTSNFSSGAKASGLGLTSDGVNGANLTRVSLGTNYQLNQSTQWKLEYRYDKSSGDLFIDNQGNAQNSKNTVATALVVSF